MVDLSTVRTQPKCGSCGEVMEPILTACPHCTARFGLEKYHRNHKQALSELEVALKTKKIKKLPDFVSVWIPVHPWDYTA